MKGCLVRIARLALVCLLLCTISTRPVLSLDVNWLPNDENAPLPLSTAYRQNLRSLCTLLSSGKKLPPELKEKKTILKKMCKKLRKDDANVAHHDKLSKLSTNAKRGAMFGVGLLAVVFAWSTKWGKMCKKWIGHQFDKYMGIQHQGGGGIRVAKGPRGGGNDVSGSCSGFSSSISSSGGLSPSHFADGIAEAAFGGGGGGGGGGGESALIVEAREARLRKFAAMNTPTTTSFSSAAVSATEAAADSIKEE